MPTLEGDLVMVSSRPTLVQRLESWYERQCNGEWEHGWGIDIGTFAVPKWHFAVELRDTKLEWHRTKWEEVRVDRDDWHCFRFTSGSYESIGTLASLPRMIGDFLAAADAKDGIASDDSEGGDCVLTWLCGWLAARFPDQPPQEPVFHLGTLDNPGWDLRLDLRSLGLSSVVTTKFSDERTETDWIHVWPSTGRFEAVGGARNLEEILNAARRIATS
jgi:Immunity protein 53